MIDPVNKKEKRIKVNIKPIEKQLDAFLVKLIKNYEKNTLTRNKLKERQSTITFPYTKYRNYQKEIIQKIEEIIPTGKRIMLHAPPGIGKTITSLYPIIKQGLAQSQRVFVITSKTTQQLIYTQAIQDFHHSGAKFKAIKITAKGKMCHSQSYDCLDMDCPYLENYFETDTRSDVTALLQLDMIERETIEIRANRRRVCPFELSLDVASHCDLILSDFNYIFHPRVKFQRFQAEFEDSLLIIDEAHNLVTRALDYYSDSLSIKEVQAVYDFVTSTQVSNQLKYQLKSNLRRLIGNIQQLKDQIVNLEIEHALIKVDKKFFDDFQFKLDELVILYLNGLPFLPDKKDILVKFSDKFKFFTILLRMTEEDEFEEIYDLNLNQVRILCKSAAKKLEEQMNIFDNVILQSATLEPLEYYKTMLGLREDTEVLSYPSPFPKEYRKYFIDPSIPTMYSQRFEYLGQLAELVHNTISLKDGNYLVFFPSFEYLEQFEKEFRKKSRSKILVQDSQMSDNKRKSVLNILKRDSNTVLLAVMGGIFAEGVDYKDAMAIGAFVISPGLPKITFDQELRKNYFDTTFGRGFDFAYRFPGISKVIQSAGRVFRSENDRGFVMFVGYRFSTPEYGDLLPADFEVHVIQDNSYQAEIIKLWK